MKSRTQRIFYWSLGSHLGLILLLVIIAAIGSCVRKPPAVADHVFSLQSAPTPPAPVPSEPVRVEPQPTPQPRPEPQPQPRPEPQPQPRPQPLQRQEPPPPAPTVRFDEFLRQNPRPVQQQQPPPQRPPVQQQSTSSVEQLMRELESLMENATAATRQSNPSDVRALHSYIARIRSTLNSLWDQPQGMPPGEWSAIIEFTVGADGSVSRVRFIQQSGDTAFDQSVIRAMNQFSKTEPPPGRQAQTFRIPFRMRQS